ncbi:STB2 Protein STB2 [Candida maltosa Xu316]
MSSPTAFPYSNSPNVYTGSKSSQHLPPRNGSVASSSANLQPHFSNPNDFITYIIPDFNAVKYFQKEFIASNEFHVIEESEATGFEIYLVEQWVNDRNVGSLITTFTGNESSKVSVIRFTIIKKPAKYYPLRFQEYLNELIQNHSRMKRMEKERPKNIHSRTSRITSTSLPPIKRENSAGDYTSEVCFVTNLTSLPSTLNLIPIPTGDVRLVESAFYINSNLKKLNCTGRSLSMITNKISDASEDKFRQMYKIYNPKVPVTFAVKELVNIIQTCLFYFDLLDARYCDGLLCAKTEEALMNWWNLIGLPHFNVKPNPVNGILPARTVAAVISLILSIRMRIQILGSSDVPKDPLDFENFMIAIGQFQRQFKLDKTRKLDMETLNKMFTVTNARLLPEKNTNYFYSSAYNDSADFDPKESPSVSTTPQKRKYGKEFKKLTNVMKYSVSNSSNKDLDDMPVPPKASSGRIRNKIAKFADNVSPLDVETLDLEYLVKNNLTGKTLFRLFYGVQSGHGFVYNDKLPEHPKHRSGRSFVDDASSKQYAFESLRDKIAQTQEVMIQSDPSKYTRGFSRMKLGLQGRKNLLTDFKPENSNTNTLMVTGDNGSTKAIETSEMVDSFLQISADNVSCSESLTSNTNSIPPQCSNTESDFKHPISKFKHNLNRRNSYPFLFDQHEENLNTLVISKNDTDIITTRIDRLTKRRAFSFSNVEDTILLRSVPNIGTMTKFSQSYLENIHGLMKYQDLRMYHLKTEKKVQSRVTNASLDKSYQMMNLELIKLKNLKSQMTTNKTRILDEGLKEDLNHNMKLLTTTIDRLFYETRIVTKRINELEENLKLYEMKLNDDCNRRIKELIDNVLRSNQFKEVYDDLEERKEIAFKLTGDKNYFDNKVEVKPIGLLRMIITFFYELLLCLFQLFHFNRDNMNLDRIRESWAKLDPNRSIIKTAYSYIGREPSKDSVASADPN